MTPNPLAALQQPEAGQQQRLFTVTDITVDETATSAVAARQRALATAQAQGFSLLMRKLLQAQDVGRVPALDLVAIEALVSGIEVADEKVSPGRYQARLTVAFNPAGVTEFLNRAQLPYVRAAGAAITILHAHRRGLAVTLFEEDPILRAARAELQLANRIRFYRLADDRLTIRRIVAAPAVLALSRSLDSPLQAWAGSEAVLLISSDWKAGQGLYYAYRLIGEGVENTGMLTLAAGEDETIVLTRMYETILDHIDTIWRRSLLVDFATITEARLWLETQSAQDFGAVHAALKSSPLVQVLTLEQLAVPLSRMQVRFRGTAEQFRLTLQSQGFSLVPYGDTSRDWLVYRPKPKSRVDDPPSEPQDAAL